MESRLEDLLTTKLALPPLRAALVARPRLIETLRAGLAGPLTLLSAPAGFGKTTLLAQVLSTEGRLLHEARAARGTALAWLSLDAGDNDPVRFWRYVIAALERASPGVGQHALGLLHNAGEFSSQAALTALINALDSQPQPLVLALDDYHAIENPDLHDGLTFLLSHMPAALHLVITSRTTPPLPLERMRVRGQVVELGAADLRFTSDEAALLLNRVMGLALSEADVDQLAERTEGWGAGLLLAALSLRGRPDAQRWIASFGGGHRAVLDYIAAEVLDHQPAELRRFLLLTAVLERLCAELCDALLAAEDGPPELAPAAPAPPAQRTLEQLERANLFLVPLDEERRWYRYHHLFADVLRARLRQTAPRLIPALQRRAARWYAAQGLNTEAIDYALAASDWDEAVRLIAQTGREMLLRSEVTTLRRWLDALPPEQLRGHPRLCLMDGWFMVLAGQLHDAEQRLAYVRLLAGQPAFTADPELPDEMLILQMTIAALRGVYTPLRELPAHLLGRLDQSPFLRSVAALLAGYPAAFSGDVTAAARDFRRAVQVGRESGSSLIVVLALCQVGELEIIQGRLRQAQQTYEQVLAEIDRAKPRSTLRGPALTGLGELARERGELARADTLLREGLSQNSALGEFNMVDGYLSMARLLRARGDFAGADQLMQRAADLAGQSRIEFLERMSRASRARLWVQWGMLERAQTWSSSPFVQIDGYPEQRPDWPYLLTEIEQLVRVRLLNAEGRYDQALRVLGWLLPHTGERTRHLIDGLMLRALALDGHGQPDLACAALEQALQLAEPEGYLRLFLDEGAPLLALLGRLAERPGPAAAYAGRLLAAAGAPEVLPAPLAMAQRLLPAAPPASLDAAQIVQLPGEAALLSPRELEVLHLIAAGLSNSDIAARLVVAESTVKKHVHNIFSKLDAQSRTHALVRARELGLLQNSV